MEQIADKLKGQCYRKTTEHNYYKIWRLFNKFFIHLDKKPESWEQRLILYVTYLIELGRTSATIKSYISAIKAILKMEGIFLNSDVFIFTALVRACRSKNDFLQIRLPIQKLLLHLILDEVYNSFTKRSQIYLRKLYMAALIMRYYGMLRVGESTTRSHPKQAENALVANNKKNIQIVLRTSKSHSLSCHPPIVKISAEMPDIALTNS